MPDGAFAPGWPLLLDERTAARFVSLGLRDFRVAVDAGLLPAGRTPHDLCRAGMLQPAQAARLATLGALWHRLELEQRAASLWGLEGQATVGQAARKTAAREALDGFTVPSAARNRHPPRR